MLLSFAYLSPALYDTLDEPDDVAQPLKIYSSLVGFDLVTVTDLPERKV